MIVRTLLKCGGQLETRQGHFFAFNSGTTLTPGALTSIIKIDEGVAGRRLAPSLSSSKRSNRRLWGQSGGYFFLLAAIKRPIMPTTKMPVWMRSEYVTIGQPPFRKIRGQKLPPVRGANRLPSTGNAKHKISWFDRKSKPKAMTLGLLFGVSICGCPQNTGKIPCNFS